MAEQEEKQEQKQATKTKKGKKSFFEVSAPITSSKIHVYGATSEEFDGRVVKLDLTRSLKGRSFELKLRIHNVGGKLEGAPMSLELMGSYIRRTIRGGIDYVEDSFDVQCRDAVARIKPFLITRRKVSRSVKDALRKTTRDFLSGYLRIHDASEIFSEIMSNKLQKQLFTKLKKVYPLSMCEIRMFFLQPGKKLAPIKEVEKKEIVEEEKREKAEELKEEALEKKAEKAEKKAKKSKSE